MLACFLFLAISKNVCPVLKCQEPRPLSLDQRACYQYSPDQNWITYYGCQKSSHTCNLRETLVNHDKGGFWVKTSTSPWKNLDSSKLLVGQCGSPLTQYKNLKSGSVCQHDFQCESRVCEDNMCRGGYAGDPCISHDQCSGNYYCGKIESEGLTWSMCIPAKGEKDNCTMNNECQNHLVCIKDKDFRENKMM